LSKEDRPFACHLQEGDQLLLLMVVHFILEVEGHQLRNEKLEVSALLHFYQVWVEAHCFQTIDSTWLVLEQIYHRIECCLLRKPSALQLLVVNQPSIELPF
jgi:hypothetical protein